MKTNLIASFVLLVISCFGLAGCGQSDASNDDGAAGADAQGPLVLYCGRKVSLVQPILDRFTAETGIEIELKDAPTTNLAALLETEGGASPADVFWAQDPATLMGLAEAGLLGPLPESLRGLVPEAFVDPNGYWVATSGRARVLAYSPERVEASDLPQSVFDLTDPQWRGRVGWAPSNGSFQAFVTAMRAMHGDQTTLQWLVAMKENDAVVYPKNTPIIEAIAAGEIDLGIPNHYYLLRFKNEHGSGYPVEQTFFANGDIGNLMMVAGIGIVKTSENQAAAERLIEFLLSEASQSYFTGDVYEYPVTEGVMPHELLVDPASLMDVMPDASVPEMSDIEGTRQLLREAGLI